MWSMFTHPLGVGVGAGGRVWMRVNTWGSAGVRRSVISKCVQNVCVFQTVNAPQKNKTSFHQAPII